MDPDPLLCSTLLCSALPCSALFWSRQKWLVTAGVGVAADCSEEKVRTNKSNNRGTISSRNHLTTNSRMLEC